MAAATKDLAQHSSACRVILTDPRGELFTQAKARELAKEEHLIFLCGRYEGVDERVSQHLVTDVLSIGDYVLTGGELPALVMIDSIVRLQEGVLGEEGAPDKDSFAEELLEYPQYTGPRDFEGWHVPDLLMEGDHARIRRWRRWHQLHMTMSRRPDVWAHFQPTMEDLQLMDMQESDL
jgi:tRNA (guanine37-N1)-methyltransferase